MELETLIAECTAYDFKVMLEEKKPKKLAKERKCFCQRLGWFPFFRHR
jgi:ATP-dependent DNA helicase RecG